MKIEILADLEAISQRAAELFAASIDRTARFSVALAGGETPKQLYEILASEPYRSKIPWHRVHFFWGDERCVPPDDPRSNYKIAHDLLLSKVPVPPENIHRMKGELEPQAAAEDYARDLQSFFGNKKPFPDFDVCFLGLGTDGHTASLFPNTPALRETKRWVVGYFVDVVKMPRLTLTLPVFNHAKNVVFLVSGSEKAAIANRILQKSKERDLLLPAERINPNEGELFWLMDRAASAESRQAD